MQGGGLHRFHFDVISIRFAFRSMSLRFHLDVASFLLRLPFDSASMSFGVRFGFMSSPLRCHFDFAPNSRVTQFPPLDMSTKKDGRGAQAPKGSPAMLRISISGRGLSERTL